MDFLILLAQIHESFRRPELEAIAQLQNTELDILEYDLRTPFCIAKLPSEAAAKALVGRSILADSVYELWGMGTTYEELHTDIRSRTFHKWHEYKIGSFRFGIHGARGGRSLADQRELINSFAYLGFAGPIKLKNPEHDFRVYELWPEIEKGKAAGEKDAKPYRFYFGRWIGRSSRDAATKFSLKKRKYINTTSMDAELSLITANFAHAAPGRIFIDPFAGTGGFCVSVAHFGALAIGGDIDGRMIRGKGDKSVMGNFEQYGLSELWLDGMVSDLTNSPLRTGGKRWVDGIVCDPPYGIREGCRVLGSRHGPPGQVHIIDGVPAHTTDDYIPPKKPYSFTALLDDILHFAAEVLVDDGRLTIWMPTANDEIEFAIPKSPYLRLSSQCVQVFSKWSRILLTYVRLPGELTGPVIPRIQTTLNGTRADDLNDFRKRYFEGFKPVKADADEKWKQSP